MTGIKMQRLTLWISPEELAFLREELSQPVRGPITLSGFVQALVDAFVDFILNFDELTPEEEELFEECGERVEGGGPPTERVSISLRPDQVVRLGELEKGFELSKGAVIRLLWEMWKEGLLDPHLPWRFRLSPREPSLEPGELKAKRRVLMEKGGK